MARNPHPEVTERRILAAAKKLFAEKGYDKTSIQDIIDKLGDLSRGAIYHHFKSKEAILERLNTDDWHASQALCDEIAKRDDMNAMEKLRSLFANSLGDAAHHRIPARSGATAGPAMQLLADAMLLPRHAHAAAVSSAMPRHHARRAARAGLRPASHRSRHGRHDGLRRRRQRQRRRATRRRRHQSGKRRTLDDADSGAGRGTNVSPLFQHRFTYRQSV